MWRYPAGPNADDFTQSRRPELITLEDVQPEEVEWVWFPYIPIGKLTILEGDPAVGKTFLALAICAEITRGSVPLGVKDDPGQRSPATVLYLTAEDGIGDTLRPRFDSLKGDAKRMVVLTGVIQKTAQTEMLASLTLSDLPMLEQALSKTKPSLVVVDPLQAYLGAQVDLHRANEVRPILAGLAQLAEKHRCAVLIIRHLSKATQGKAIYRGLGSIDITAASRSVLLVGTEPDPPHRRAIVHLKSSLAQQGDSILYSLENGQFTWVGPCKLTASELTAPEMSSKDRSALEEAKEFLLAALKDDPKASVDVEAEAIAQGISKRTFYRARKALGVKSRQQGFKGPWMLELPIPVTVGQDDAQIAF